MAFLRITRDKRGYEHFYLIQPNNKRGKTPRLLYWFRTPPHVKMGREPFDVDVRRALELGNPDVAFDWKTINETPVPPVVEPEKWRERRRLERASRQTPSVEGDVEAAPSEQVVQLAENSAFAPGEDAPLRVRATDIVPLAAPTGGEPQPVDPAPGEVAREGIATESPLPASNAPEASSDGAPAARRARRRRRRRRGRARPDGPSPLVQDQATANDPGSDDAVEFVTSGGEDNDDTEDEGVSEEPASPEESKLPNPEEP